MSDSKLLLVSAFYKFFPFSGYAEHQQPLLALMQAHQVRGSILLASEGVNGTICGADAAIATVHAALEALPGAGTIVAKHSRAQTPPFARAKVRLKKEIVSFGGAITTPPGTYLTPQEWNALLNDSEVVVVDARNSYETHLGSFQHARDPNTRTFRQLKAYTHTQLDPKQHKKVASFCTGGIRCEKYTAWLKEQGFEEVYHLEGGILRYLEEVPPEQSLWQGSCYVFDERLAVTHGLQIDKDITQCPQCGHPLTVEDRTHPDYKAGEKCCFCQSFPPSNMDVL